MPRSLTAALAFDVRQVSGRIMAPHTRTMLAASVYALVTGETVAGVYDHSNKRHLRIAAETRGEHLQGFDGERGTKFGGTLPEVFDAGTRTFVSIELDNGGARGYDRASSTFFTATVSAQSVQLYDHSISSWFAFDLQTV
jgi:hypothetical protein